MIHAYNAETDQLIYSQDNKLAVINAVRHISSSSTLIELRDDDGQVIESYINRPSLAGRRASYSFPRVQTNVKVHPDDRQSVLDYALHTKRQRQQGAPVEPQTVPEIQPGHQWGFPTVQVGFTVHEDDRAVVRAHARRCNLKRYDPATTDRRKYKFPRGPVTVQVHDDDRQAIRDYAAMLCEARQG